MISPHLQGFVLTISSHSGPQFVYHYEPTPTAEDDDQEDELDFDFGDDESSLLWSSSDEESASSPNVPLNSTHPTPTSSSVGPGFSRNSHTGTSAHSTDGGSILTEGGDNDDGPGVEAFGFDGEFLAELLCPPRDMCNQRFEMFIDDRVFLGVPVHILPSGTWRQLRNHGTPRDSTTIGAGSGMGSNSGRRASTGTTSSPKMDASVILDSGELNSADASVPARAEDTKPFEIQESNPGVSLNFEIDHPKESGELDQGPGIYVNPANEDAHLGHKSELSEGLSLLPETLTIPYQDVRSQRSKVNDLQVPDDNEDLDVSDLNHNFEPDTNPEAQPRAYTEDDSPLRMFHLVMVLRPPVTEVVDSIEMLYRFIVAPFARMLRHEQATKNYVWEQCQQIIRAREEGRDPEAVSELARALRDLYASVSRMGIARLQVGRKLRAFQIPVQLEMCNLQPLPRQNHAPDAYLSTANIPDKEIGQDVYECYGLLLLDDPEAIVQEIEVDSGGPVAAMIRNIQPSLSIQALAYQHSIDLRQMVTLVYSLVYWRRARIIVPLHHRHVYGVSPLAPLDNRFNDLAAAYAELFPMTPPLPRILASLSSGRPQPYIFHIPTRDHREIYMRILEWLLQHNLVVHLATFVLIVVTRKVKLAVLHQLMADDSPSVNPGSERSSPPPPEIQQQTQQSLEVGTKGAGGDSGTDNTAKFSRKTKRASSNHEYSPYFSETELQDSIIATPVRASLQEKRWLNQITVGHSPESAALFHRLSKYFNGKDCLEQVIVREGLSRAELRRFMHEFGANLITYRHW